jgi:hypothetical protein
MVNKPANARNAVEKRRDHGMIVAPPSRPRNTATSGPGRP